MAGKVASVGEQRRYRRATSDGYEIPVPARARDLDLAVERITSHLRHFGVPGIYTGAGKPVPLASHPEEAPALVGADRVQQGFAADGSDTYLLVEPGEPVEDLRDRLYRSRNYATPRMAARSQVADMLYTAIGLGTLEPAPTDAVSRLAEHIVTYLHQHGSLGQMLAHRCWLLRDWLGLPTDTWPHDTQHVATQGRRRCVAQPTGDEPRWTIARPGVALPAPSPHHHRRRGRRTRG